MDKKNLQQIESVIDYHFSDANLLDEAFTHSSFADNRLDSNERLEFLGDAVLDLVICQSLFERFSDYLEGDLTKIKSMLVSRVTCAKLANEMKLSEFIKIGKGMEANDSISKSVAAGVFESVIGAIYLDGGLDAVREFILRVFDSLVTEADAEQHQNNFKSLLQQYAQNNMDATPAYELLDEKGPDHNKCFETAVVINEHYFPSAWGTNKKQAEQKAAFNALVELGQLEDEDWSEENI